MKAAQDIILKPVITEKSMDELQNGKYTFKEQVHPGPRAYG